MQSKELSDTCLGRGHTSVAAHALPVDRLSIASFSVLLIAVQGMGPVMSWMFSNSVAGQGSGEGPHNGHEGSAPRRKTPPATLAQGRMQLRQEAHNLVRTAN